MLAKITRPWNIVILFYNKNKYEVVQSASLKYYIGYKAKKSIMNNALYHYIMNYILHWPTVSMRSLKVPAQTIDPSLFQIHETVLERWS